MKTDRRKIPSHWEYQIKVPELQPSMSLSDLVNNHGQRISEQMISGNPKISHGDPKNGDILEEITRYLLRDSQLTSASDEQHLMSRVNSLCCLLQRDPGSVRNLPSKSCIDLEVDDDRSIEARGFRNFVLMKDPRMLIAGVK
ncbi:hypothetical protein GH714_025774 [Hevea brasiliensis]|uniref:Uncharacterized protein n=1 Tax=Hevea brasiliensis TaxID=3981 RepID=A0A6A6LKN3_HEVBR|nr:hypothetical protein GH714_025653 [Hevea brasiliensis]KAF2301554.1 hypothetical protein GH714_025774 [Hevea brasiliensis]